MKKLYLFLAALAVTSGAGAKQLTFYLGDTPIANEETVYFNEIETIDLGGIYDISMEPELYVLSDVNASNVAISAECLSEQEIQLCTDNLCAIGEYVSKENLSVTAGTKLPLQLHYYGTEAEIPEVTVEVTGIFGEEEATFTSFTIVMGEKAGITVIEHAANLKAVRGAIEYKLDSEETFTLYSADGALVLKTDVSGTGSISTSELRKGIYVYTLGSGKGKLYIH